MKRNMRISAISFIIAIAAMMRIISHDEIRTVALIVILATGMSAGILLTNIVLYKKQQ